MNKIHMRKKVFFIIIGIIIITIFTGGTWWLLNSGRFANFGFNPQLVAVCDTTIVDEYNDVMYFKTRNGSDMPSIDEAGVKNLVTNIKTKSNFENDPTCQTIIFWSAVRDDNYKVARGAYDTLINLHKKRIFVDSNLRNNNPLFTYEETMKGLSGSGFSESDGFGG